ncbi:hypothetical protein scyTo_0023396, partial [Scyliorhinus torazame]|nr:hypothetical protein [Scyliorhinus torazame]
VRWKAKEVLLRDGKREVEKRKGAKRQQSATKGAQVTEKRE